MSTSVTTFTTINGIMVHEDRSGVETSYIPDPLGNLIECRNSSGTKTYSAEYWPYGEVQTSTGTNPSPWGFVGLLGYLVDAVSILYVRARYLMTKFARWLTVDPIWPIQASYAYAAFRPVDIVDSSGMIIPLIAIDILILEILIAYLEMIALLLFLCGILAPLLTGGLFGGTPEDICKTCISFFLAIWLRGAGLGGLGFTIWGTFAKDFVNLVGKPCKGDDKNHSVPPCGDSDRDIPAGRLILRQGNKNVAG